jgi:hypothetical protein
MSQDTAQSSAGPAEAPGAEVPEPALEWSFNPWRERPAAAGLASAAALGLCLVILSLGESTVLTLALCLAAVGALAPLIGPIRCRLDGEGAGRLGALGWERRRWTEVRRCALRRAGLLLSPYSRAHWLDSYRGLFLPLPAREREALLPEIRPRLALHGL